MNYALLAAAILSFVLGGAHSLLGERTVLGPLFASGNLPKLFGSEDFTRQTLRFTWHVTTILLWGIGGSLALLALARPGYLLGVIALMFALCFVLTFVVTRGRHFAWAVFLAIAVLVWVARG